MREVPRKYSSFLYHPLQLFGRLFGIVCIVSIAYAGIISFAHVPAVYASASKYQDVTPCQIPPPQEPGSTSLLVVLLDRSGSLVDGSGATDPSLYSASVTRALADVWPGKMAVVAFNTTNPSGHDEQVQLKTIGPLQVGDSKAQRQELQNEVLTLPRPSLGTPTGPAMDQALALIKSTNAPLSKVVLITDGEPGYHSNNASLNDPSGSKEERYIRTTLLAKFCAASAPVDTIGLKTDPNANSLLSDIATGTGGQYQTVQDPKDLATVVFGLYAQWQQNRIDFQPLQLQPDGTYHVSIGDLARSLQFFVFQSNNSVTVDDPKGQPLASAVENAVDPHYVYDTLDLSPPRPDGTYTINVGGDTQAQVYAFVASSLNVGIDTPNEKTQPVIDQHVHIEARLLNGQEPLASLNGAAALSADVTFTAPGQKPIMEQLTLQQQGSQNLFAGTTTSTYPQAGQLQIIVQANYIDLRAESDFTTQVVCGSSVPCRIKQYQTAIAIALPCLLLLLVLLIFWLIWSQQPTPFGTLRTPPSPARRRRRDDDDDEATLSLALVEAAHPLRQRIFQRSRLTSNDISRHPDAKGNFDFDLASFDLLFKRGHVAKIKSTAMEEIIIKREDNQSEKVEQGQSALLRNGDIIYIANKDRAIFSNL